MRAMWEIVPQGMGIVTYVRTGVMMTKNLKILGVY